MLEAIFQAVNDVRYGDDIKSGGLEPGPRLRSQLTRRIPQLVHQGVQRQQGAQPTAGMLQKWDVP